MTSEIKIYDVEFVVPVCSKYMERIDDFKKYGLVNIKDRRVLLTLILSAEQIEGLKEGWPEGVVPNVVENERSDFVSNVYRYFLDSPKRSRWIVKMDDDSCTDVNGLIARLDEFYEWEEPCYLATSITTFVRGREHSLKEIYENYFEEFYLIMKHEYECSIFTNALLDKIRKNEKSNRFLTQRSSLAGGATDIALAFASTLAKVPVSSFPFSSHLALIENFSLVGGYLNHIHLISRKKVGENFSRFKNNAFNFLTKIVDKKMTKMESSIVGKRILIESKGDMFIVKFNSDYTATLKPRCRRVLWMECDGVLLVFFEIEKPWISIKKKDEVTFEGSFYDTEEKINLTVLA